MNEPIRYRVGGDLLNGIAIDTFSDGVVMYFLIRTHGGAYIAKKICDCEYREETKPVRIKVGKRTGPVQ